MDLRSAPKVAVERGGAQYGRVSAVGCPVAAADLSSRRIYSRWAAMSAVQNSSNEGTVPSNTFAKKSVVSMAWYITH